MAQYLIGNIKGPKGADGFSPTATVTQTTGGAIISITDASGTTSATIRNGIDGTGEPVDLSPYATNESVDYKIANAGYATPQDIEDAIDDIEFPVTSVNGMTGNVVIETGGAEYTAGTNISISEENVISATNTTYSAGNGLALLGTEFQVDTNTVALKSELFSGDYDDLTNKPTIPNYAAGNNITISNNVISATDTTYTAGTGISISNGVISATGGGGSSYTAGDGIEIENDIINVIVDGTTIDFDEDGQLTIGSDIPDKNYVDRGLNAKQDTLTAGSGIDITNNVISATGGGSSYDWEDDVYVANSIDSTGLADFVTAYAGGKLYPIIKYGEDYYKLVKQRPVSTRTVFHYLSFNITRTGDWQYLIPQINIAINNDYTFNSASYQPTFAQIPVDARGLAVRAAESVTSAASTVAADLTYIKTNYATKSEIPTPDGTTITSNNGVWSAVGGGGVSDPIELTGNNSEASMASADGFKYKYYDGTHEEPFSGTSMDNYSVTAFENEFDDSQQTHSTYSMSMYSKGITFNNPYYETSADLAVGAGGVLLWNNEKIHTGDSLDLDDGLASRTSIIAGKADFEEYADNNGTEYVSASAALRPQGLEIATSDGQGTSHTMNMYLENGVLMVEIDGATYTVDLTPTANN